MKNNQQDTHHQQDPDKRWQVKYPKFNPNSREQFKIPQNMRPKLDPKYQNMLNQSKQKRGSRQQMIKKMTTISEKVMDQFSQARCYKDLWQFHKKNTPWLDDTQINEIIRHYKRQAQDLKDKGELKQVDYWRLNDL